MWVPNEDLLPGNLSVQERLCPVEECYGGAGEKCEEEGLA